MRRENILLAAGWVLSATLGTAQAATPAKAAQAFGPANPFYAPSSLPFQAPPFNRIHDADYQPAIEAGIVEQSKQFQDIADQSAPPTFDNTIVALERSGQLLSRVNLVFNAITSANTNPTLEHVQEIEAPKLAALADAEYLNPKLFDRIEAIYKQRASLHLTPEQRRLVEYDYQQFVKAGARLQEADKTKLKRLNQEDATLQTVFMKKLLAAAKAAAYQTTDRSALAGMSAAQVDAAAQNAKARGVAGYVIALQNTTQQPDLTELSNRATRQKIFDNSWTRTERGDANDTRATIARLAQLRAQEAQLLGYPNYAAWELQDQMAKTPEAAFKFMNALVPATVAKAKAEGDDIQALIDKQHGGFQLQPWDWNFYAEQVRRMRYDLDENQVKPYFELDRVLKDGVFYAAHQLYGLTFKERHDIPVYQPEVRVFEVYDANGKPLALWYCDYFKRDNKSGGAWMSNFVNQSTLLGTLPVIYNVANFAEPAAGQPALISFDDVTTMFHEFGHALHGMFADTVYPSLSGTSVPRDFVEFPSQFNEHWASYPQVFDHYALNYKTGQPMPASLKAKVMRAMKFNEGYALGEILEAALLDMQWHTLPASAPLQNVDSFEKQALERVHMDLRTVPPRYRSSYFLHIWANGYAAGYYAYLWTEMLDDQAFQWFQDHGGMTRANGERFRRMVLSRGNTEDLQAMYDRWLGGAPSVEPMLKDRGLVGAEANQ
ncbi:MAG TPA: peptidyl-dipeptidase Dcp [Steroidobacteraceae bacterium]|nr:peptidyl-dipeptidase Dcp [Steroidobacteraceae bacterium]